MTTRLATTDPDSAEHRTGSAPLVVERGAEKVDASAAVTDKAGTHKAGTDKAGTLAGGAGGAGLQVALSRGSAGPVAAVGRGLPEQEWIGAGVQAELSGRLAELADTVGRALPGDGLIGVAFSAGVDSTVLLALAVRARGAANVVAITGDSPSLARRELEQARELAGLIGVRLVEVPTAEGEVAAYRKNGLDRCFHCKDTLFRTIDATRLVGLGLAAVAYGETADDTERDDRPGAVAASRHGVLRPLAAAGLRKPDIRAIAAALGLPNADKPAAPCLASRIPHGEEVTPAKLRQIEQAEGALHDLGLPDLRVRHHGALARLEVPLDRLAEVAASPLRERVLAAVRAAGFTMVTLDLGGLRSGELFQIARKVH